jgi:UDP-N-acetyl-D-mannosaminuronic acid dehydrogenase
VDKEVCVIGLGYIGLPTAALLANRGYRVYGVDIVQDTIETINRGEIHIVEPDLDIIVKEVVAKGKLSVSTIPHEADIFIISVPTPFYHNGDDIPTPNIAHVLDATKSIIPYIRDNNIVILESTSPIGTTKKIEQLLKGSNIDIEKISIAYCPERVLPGKIIKELLENDRIVGGINKKSTNEVVKFYKTFVKGEVLSTDAKTAEMAKLTENSFRDVNIAFANELSIVCDKFGIDVWRLRELANRHPRVNILYPSVGVGGHCIAVDPWFIVSGAKDETKLIRTAREVNNYKTEWVIEKIKNEALKFELENKKQPKVVCMGLAFKPNIDDLRESPSLYVTRELISCGLKILAVEPNIKSFNEFDIVEYNKAVKEADIIVFLVAHREFEDIKIDSTKEIVDFCGVYRS